MTYGASPDGDRAGRPTAQAPAGLGDTATIPSAALPKSIGEAELKIGNVTLRFHVLDNGQRIIEAESFHAFMAAMEDGSVVLSEEDSMKLAKAVAS